jgi:hypothetical protein
MREILKEDITPSTFALGAAAAVRYIAVNKVDIGTGPVTCRSPGLPSADEIESILACIWKDAEPDKFKDTCVKLIIEANAELDTMI